MQTMQSQFGGFGMNQNPPPNDPNLSWQFFQNLANASQNYTVTEPRKSSKRKVNTMEIDESEPLRKKMHSLSFGGVNGNNYTFSSPLGGGNTNFPMENAQFPLGGSSGVSIEALDDNHEHNFSGEINGSYLTDEVEEKEEEENERGALIPFRSARSVIMEPIFREQKEAFKRYLKNTDKNTIMNMLRDHGIVISLPKILEFLEQDDEKENKKKEGGDSPRIVEIFDDDGDDMNQSDNNVPRNNPDEGMDVD